MALTTLFGSIGFVAKFIIAFIIIAFLYSRDHNDNDVRRGFVILCALGAAVLVLAVLLFLGVFAFSGAAFLGDALTGFHYHSYFG